MNLFDKVIDQYKVIIIFGMFGTGKTELAISTAIKVRERYEKVSLADIDTISPYFRSRDQKEALAEWGVEVLTPPKHLMRADLPIIVPQVGGYIQNPEYRNVIDVGGNDDGATVLGSLNNFIKGSNHVGLLVINKNRPFSEDPAKVKKQIENLTGKSRVKADYIINNTNIGDQTDEKIIMEGEEYIEKISSLTGIPVLCTVLGNGVNIKTKYEPFLLVKRYMEPKF